MYREVGTDAYRLELPTTLAGGELRRVPEESRTIQGWRGHLCGDALADVFVNVTSLGDETLHDAAHRLASRLHAPTDAPRPITVRGAEHALHALRLDGTTHRGSQAEPERRTIVLAAVGPSLLTLTIRTWPREDVAAEVERIVGSFAVKAPS